MKVNMEVTFCGVHFPNPLLAASTDMSRTEDSFDQLLESGVGGIITKSVTDAEALQSAGIARFDIRGARLKPVRGDVPTEYTFLSRGGSMVSMETFQTYAPQQLAKAKEKGVVLIGSISAAKLENWILYAKEMEAMGFSMLELNFGNPHGEAADGKLGFLIGQSPELAAEVAQAVIEAVSIPVLVKLTPQVADLTALVLSLQEKGIKAVTVMHRYQGLMVDLEEEAVALGGWAAVGGTWMKPISLANVAKVYRRAPGVEICGGNGADTGRDVVEFMACGASLVQVGSTLMLKGAEEAKTILTEMEVICKAKGITEITEICGSLADKIVTYQNLSQLPPRESVIDASICRQCRDKPCLKRCYFGSLSQKEGIEGRNSQACTGCGMCLHICPLGAVIMVTERGESVER